MRELEFGPWQPSSESELRSLYEALRVLGVSEGRLSWNEREVRRRMREAVEARLDLGELEKLTDEAWRRA